MDTFEAVEIAEYGTAKPEQIREAWQHLIDTGICWQLQGWFGRTAKALIETGECHV